jgi:hypothetical protein
MSSRQSRLRPAGGKIPGDRRAGPRFPPEEPQCSGGVGYESREQSTAAKCSVALHLQFPTERYCGSLHRSGWDEVRTSLQAGSLSRLRPENHVTQGQYQVAALANGWSAGRLVPSKPFIRLGLTAWLTKAAADRELFEDDAAGKLRLRRWEEFSCASTFRGEKARRYRPSFRCRRLR